MDSWKANLIGQLIGLARATDGNEHLISAQSTALVRDCLAASPDSDEALAQLLGRVEEVKRAMAPDCFLCANPCGKTAAFDLAELDQLPAEERNAKQRILKCLLQFCTQIPEASLYRGLIALGMAGLPVEFLKAIEQELTV